MTEVHPTDEGGEEPTEADLKAWLSTPEGAAAMEAVMKDAVTGGFGEVAPGLMEQAQEGLRMRHSFVVMGEVNERFEQLCMTMLPLPEGSRWAHVNGQNVEMTALMDLMLEVHEPHRSKLLRQLLPVQQQSDNLLKKL